MIYSISNTLQILPYMAYALLGIVWIIMEVKNFLNTEREPSGERP